MKRFNELRKKNKNDGFLKNVQNNRSTFWNVRDGGIRLKLEVLIKLKCFYGNSVEVCIIKINKPKHVYLQSVYPRVHNSI